LTSFVSATTAAASFGDGDFCDALLVDISLDARKISTLTPRTLATTPDRNRPAQCYDVTEKIADDIGAAAFVHDCFCYGNRRRQDSNRSQATITKRHSTAVFMVAHTTLSTDCPATRSNDFFPALTVLCTQEPGEVGKNLRRPAMLLTDARVQA
jgi:hypothetical protein